MPTTKLPSPITPEQFLGAAYDQLGYQDGLGFHIPTNRPSEISQSDIVDKFGWLRLAEEIQADRIFFVDNNPVVLFFKLNHANEDAIRELHIKVWNMSKVPFFFVALPGELRLYNAYEKPIRDIQQWNSEQRWLRRVEDVTRVAEVLNDFSRAEIETERAFSFVKRDDRADEWLLNNLRLLRQHLERSELSLEHTLNLIGRSIFIRYLEDRKVLLEDYFLEVTSRRARNYFDVLESKKDTYKLFSKLRHDFNGNMFPLSDDEERSVTPERLDLLRRFLSGESMGEQTDLFFWAYKFDVIPIELISSIYEEFYHKLEERDTRGTHYTPSSLVDFVLSQLLTSQELESGTILDLACGSGIFLVEAFRRMVHYQMGKQQRKLRPNQLVKLLQERIFGIDINGAAIRVAAFSLYLALLDFMEPSDIRQHKLPILVHEDAVAKNGSFNLFEANSFWLTPAEKRLLDQKQILASTTEEWPALPIGDRKFSLIVGNPPWGASSSGEENEQAIRWCNAFGWPVSDKELSQCFIWRTRSLLTPNGTAGLLVSSGVLFKHSQTSQRFQQTLLSTNQIRSVYNFTHVRRVYFSTAISPFLAIFFAPANREDAFINKVIYATAKRSYLIDNLQVVMLDKFDFHRIPQKQLLENNKLWKILSWGGVQDIQLIDEIKSNGPLLGFTSDYGRGYQKNRNGTHPSSELGVDLELPTEFFSRHITKNNLRRIPSRHLSHVGATSLYHGNRLLIKRGITERGEKLAEIESALADQSFAFRNSVHAIGLDKLTEEQRKVVLGILWSSFTLYYHFHTCSTWGFWRHEIHLSEHLDLPIRLPKSSKFTKRIVRLVDQLIASEDTKDIFVDRTESNRLLEGELDNAIFDLYELTEAQQDLIKDFHEITLDFFYKGTKSNACKPPTPDNLSQYKQAFMDVWQSRLEPKGKELESSIFFPVSNPLLGISFELKKLGTAKDRPPITDIAEWDKLFHRLSHALPERLSHRIYLDRTVKALDGSSMLLIKRAEKRFWTKSQARQDAHELLTDVFKREWQQQG